MKLEGSLDAFSLPDVFQLLSLTKKSGGLHLANGQVSGAVYFAQGEITGAVSDEARQGLARRLVGLGVVDDAALRRAVDRCAAESIGVARAVLESGSADADVLRTLATEHTIDAVFDLLRWPNGDFSFTVDEANPDEVGISVSSEEVVTEATARRDTWDGVSKVIPSPDVVLTMPVVLDDDPSVSRDEWALLSLIDGSRSVGDLVALSGAGQYGVVAALASLVQRGLLLLRDEDAADHVTVVLRRQALLGVLEGRYQQAPDAGPDAAPEAVPNGTSIVAPLVADPSSYPQQSVQQSAQLSVQAPAQQYPPGQPTSSPALPPGHPQAPAARLGGAHQPEDVVPPRPEPFLPKRSVDHPEPESTPSRAGFPAPGTPVAPVQPRNVPGPPVTQPGAVEQPAAQHVVAHHAAAPPSGPVAQPMAQPMAHPMTRPMSAPVSMGGSMGGAAAAAQPIGHSAIERDPSVNRSLLLRLIAGVRGL